MVAAPKVPARLALKRLALAGACLLALSCLACRARVEDPFVTMAKKYAGGKYVDLATYYQKATGVKLGIKGIILEVDPASVAAIMDSINSGYMTALPFRIEKNYGQGGQKDKIAVVTALNQFDLVSALHTQGKEDKVSTSAIVKGLKALNAKTKIKIDGAGIDFVEIKFAEEPKDWAEIAKDCQAIAPDIVTYGTGSLAKLQQELEQYKLAVLWWN